MTIEEIALLIAKLDMKLVFAKNLEFNELHAVITNAPDGSELIDQLSR